MHFSPEIINQEHNQSFPLTINGTDLINEINSTTSIMMLFDVNATAANSNNDSSLVLPVSLSITYRFPWDFRWNFIILLASSLVFIVFLMSVGVWYWCKQVNHLSRRRSLPFTTDDFIQTTNIKEKRLSSSPKPRSSVNIPPPVPPRPTAYKTSLGTIEYRSNL